MSLYSLNVISSHILPSFGDCINKIHDINNINKIVCIPGHIGIIYNNGYKFLLIDKLINKSYYWGHPTINSYIIIMDIIKNDICTRLIIIQQNNVILIWDWNDKTQKWIFMGRGVLPYDENNENSHIKDGIIYNNGDIYWYDNNNYIYYGKIQILNEKTPKQYQTGTLNIKIISSYIINYDEEFCIQEIIMGKYGIFVVDQYNKLPCYYNHNNNNNNNKILTRIPTNNNNRNKFSYTIHPSTNDIIAINEINSELLILKEEKINSLENNEDQSSFISLRTYLPISILKKCELQNLNDQIELIFCCRYNVCIIYKLDDIYMCNVYNIEDGILIDTFQILDLSNDVKWIKYWYSKTGRGIGNSVGIYTSSNMFSFRMPSVVTYTKRYLEKTNISSLNMMKVSKLCETYGISLQHWRTKYLLESFRHMKLVNNENINEEWLDNYTKLIGPSIPLTLLSETKYKEQILNDVKVYLSQMNENNDDLDADLLNSMNLDLLNIFKKYVEDESLDTLPPLHKRSSIVTKQQSLDSMIRENKISTLEKLENQLGLNELQNHSNSKKPLAPSHLLFSREGYCIDDNIEKYPYFETVCRLYDEIKPENLTPFLLLVTDLAPGNEQKKPLESEQQLKDQLILQDIHAFSSFTTRALHALPTLTLKYRYDMTLHKKQLNQMNNNEELIKYFNNREEYIKLQRRRVQARCDIHMMLHRISDAVLLRLNMALIERQQNILDVEIKNTLNIDIDIQKDINPFDGYHEKKALELAMNIEMNNNSLRAELYHHFISHWFNILAISNTSNINIISLPQIILSFAPPSEDLTSTTLSLLRNFYQRKSSSIEKNSTTIPSIFVNENTQDTIAFGHIKKLFIDNKL